MKYETLKLLKDNIRQNRDDLGCKEDFLDITPKAQSVKEIIDNLNFIKNVCPVKDNVKRMRKQATAREHVFSKDPSDKGMLCDIYMEHLKLNKKKTTNQIKNGPKILTDTSPKKIYR